MIVILLAIRVFQDEEKLFAIEAFRNRWFPVFQGVFNNDPGNQGTMCLKFCPNV